jgi:hypothetical protein
MKKEEAEQGEEKKGIKMLGSFDKGRPYNVPVSNY